MMKAFSLFNVTDQADDRPFKADDRFVFSFLSYTCNRFFIFIIVLVFVSRTDQVIISANFACFVGNKVSTEGKCKKNCIIDFN